MKLYKYRPDLSILLYKKEKEEEEEEEETHRDAEETRSVFSPSCEVFLALSVSEEET